jgi:hypothetical protein
MPGVRPDLADACRIVGMKNPASEPSAQQATNIELRINLWRRQAKAGSIDELEPPVQVQRFYIKIEAAVFVAIPLEAWHHALFKRGIVNRFKVCADWSRVDRVVGNPDSFSHFQGRIAASCEGAAHAVK